VNLDAGVAMKGKASERLVRIIAELQKESAL